MKNCEKCGEYDPRGCLEVTHNGNMQYLCDNCADEVENCYLENN